MSWFDLGKPPLTVLRWLGILGLALAWWAQGAATSPPHRWVPFVVIAAALILPDVAGFAIGGFKVQLKEAQEDIKALALRLDVSATAISMAGGIHNYYGNYAGPQTPAAVEADKMARNTPDVPFPDDGTAPSTG